MVNPLEIDECYTIGKNNFIINNNEIVTGAEAEITAEITQDDLYYPIIPLIINPNLKQHYASERSIQTQPQTWSLFQLSIITLAISLALFFDIYDYAIPSSEHYGYYNNYIITNRTQGDITYYHVAYYFSIVDDKIYDSNNFLCHEEFTSDYCIAHNIFPNQFIDHKKYQKLSFYDDDRSCSCRLTQYNNQNQFDSYLLTLLLTSICSASIIIFTILSAIMSTIFHWIHILNDGKF
jgi:hypothetical protein